MTDKASLPTVHSIDTPQMEDMQITAELVRELFDYCPETGFLTHKRSNNKAKPGLRAGHQRRDGYRQINCGGHCMSEHRIVWLWWYGEWPKQQLDHINRCKSDNRIANLRDVDQGTNMRNRDKYVRRRGGHRGGGRPNPTGLVGARRLGDGAWFSTTQVAGRRIYLGQFETAEAAHAAYMAAQERIAAGLPARA